MSELEQLRDALRRGGDFMAASVPPIRGRLLLHPTATRERVKSIGPDAERIADRLRNGPLYASDIMSAESWTVDAVAALSALREAGLVSVEPPSPLRLYGPPTVLAVGSAGLVGLAIASLALRGGTGFSRVAFAGGIGFAILAALAWRRRLR